MSRNIARFFHFSLETEFNALRFIDYTIPRLCSTYAVAIFLCLVVTFRPRSHSDYLAPSETALSKRSTMVHMFPLINILNCLSPPICVLKHVRTRLIILTGGKNNQKIKVAETVQFAIGIRPLDCKCTFYHFRKY